MNIYPSHPCGFNVVAGNMFAQKSTFGFGFLNKELRRKDENRSVVFLKVSFSVKEMVKKTILTHDSVSFQGDSYLVPIDFNVLNWWESNIKQNKSRKLSLVLDEVQFMSQEIADQLLILVEKYEAKILVTGLTLDYKGVPFETTLRCIAYADSVIKLSSICELCEEPAVYAHLKAESTERFIESDGEEFMPLCRKCFRKEKGYVLYKEIEEMG